MMRLLVPNVITNTFNLGLTNRKGEIEKIRVRHGSDEDHTATIKRILEVGFIE